MKTEQVLNERGTTHGRFEDNAEVAQRLKEVLRSREGWANLTHVQRESLEMCCHKMARIVSGNSQFADHWVDLAGYASLVVRELSGG